MRYLPTHSETVTGLTKGFPMRLDGARLMVVGGAGLIGSHVVDELLRHDVKEIVVHDDFSRGSLDNLQHAVRDPRVRISPNGGNILHRDLLERAMQGMDGVFHLAAVWLLQCQEFPETAFEVNVRGTFNVAMAAIASKVKRVVYSSSASVYGNALHTPMDEDHPYNNQTFYGATKIAGEHMLKSLGHRYGLSWTGLRYMNVYGPRQDYKGAYTAVMHKILDAIEAGKPPVVYGDGSQMYDFIHVEDVARANVLAMEADAQGFYNVGRGIGTTIKELAELLLRLTGCKTPIQHVASGPTFVTHRIGCTRRAERDLGFRWSVDLEEGMRSLIDWRRRPTQRAAAA
jgi:UDP-glucose 4-epimerase